MKRSFSEAKSNRILDIYSRLINGELLDKTSLAQQYGVNERSIQRDIETLRIFLAEQEGTKDIIFDFHAKGYRIIGSEEKELASSEVLAVCKILLESRSMRKDELFPILDKLIALCLPVASRKELSALVANEMFHYIEPRHGQPLLKILSELEQAIQTRRVIEITYEKLKGEETVNRSIEPVGLMFSEYYFYLTGFIQKIDKETAFQNPDDLFPTIYRVDRIRALRVTEEHFHVPYKSRFEEGEFRKRVQFMYGGKLQQITFKYKGPSIEAVLDRLPTAEIVHKEEDGWIVTAEVFGNGINMWLRSQGDYVEQIENRC